MRCVICDKELVIKYKYGLKIYKHDDGSICKYLNNSKMKVNDTNFIISNDRMLYALIETNAGIKKIASKFKELSFDDLAEFLDKYHEEILSILDKVVKVAGYNVAAYLKIYLEVFNMNSKILNLERVNLENINLNECIEVNGFREACNHYKDNKDVNNLFINARDEANDAINNISKNIKHRNKLKDKILRLRKYGGVKE